MPVPRIGMRNIKTALSVVLCIIILRLFKVESPFFACIAAIITMQNKINISFKTGLNRMIGTIIGACFGILFTLLSPQNIFLIGFGIIMVIYITNILNKKDSASIACIVFLAIMLNITGSPVQYSLLRVFETFVGIIVAVGINYLVFPPEKQGGEAIKSENTRNNAEV